MEGDNGHVGGLPARRPAYERNVTVPVRRVRRAQGIRVERREAAEDRKRGISKTVVKLREAILKLRKKVVAWLQEEALINKWDAELTVEMEDWDPPLEHDDELRTLWLYGVISLVICTLCGIGAGALAFVVMGVLLPDAPAAGQWFFSALLGFVTLYLCHVAAEACFRRGEDGRPQFPKVVFVLLVVLALSSGMWVANMRGDLGGAKTTEQAGELTSSRAQETTDRLDDKSVLAHLLLILCIEACGGIAGSYASGMLRYVRPRVEQYRKRRNYEKRKCDIATAIEQTELEIKEKEQQLNDLQKGDNLCVIAWDKPETPPAPAAAARVWPS